MNKIILEKAIEVRAILEKEHKNNKVWRENLCGACAVGSLLLKKELKEQGINSLFVLGEHPDCLGSHCWIEVANSIVDITASQLNIPLKIYIGPKTKEYKTKFWEDRAKEVVESWGEEQAPSSYPHLFPVGS